MTTEQEELLASIDRAYSNGFADGYDKGSADTIEQMNILGLVNFKTLENPITRKVTLEIDYDSRLNSEQIVAIILEQLKEQGNDN